MSNENRCWTQPLSSSDVSQMSLNVALVIGSSGFIQISSELLTRSQKTLFNAERDVCVEQQRNQVLLKPSAIWFRHVDSVLQPERPLTSIQLGPIVLRCLLALTASFWCGSGPEPSQWLSIQRTSQWALYHTIVSARVFGPFRNTENKHGGNSSEQPMKCLRSFMGRRGKWVSVGN